MPGDCFGQRRRYGVCDLKRLLGSWAAEEVVARESLDERRLAHGDGPVKAWVHRHCAVTGNQGPRLAPLEPSVRDRPFPWLERPDLADDPRRVRHCRHVE